MLQGLSRLYTSTGLYSRVYQGCILVQEEYAPGFIKVVY